MTIVRNGRARLALIRPDGSVVREHDFDTRCEIGRRDVDMVFPDDAAMADAGLSAGAQVPAEAEEEADAAVTPAEEEKDEGGGEGPHRVLST